MNTMDKKVAMCNQLNIDFEEANELFGEESLESMQMARVNGGFAVVGPIIKIISAIGAIAGVISCVDQLTSSTEVSPGGPTIQTRTVDSFIQEITKQLQKAIKNGEGEIIVRCDSITEKGIYNYSLTIKLGTPAE